MGTASLAERRAIKGAAKRRATLPRAARPQDLEQLLEQLVQRARQAISSEERINKPALPPPSGREKVLLDMETNGVRCLLLQSIRESEFDKPGPEHEEVILSPHEQEIVRMVIKGHPNKTIAAVLEISTWTVATYLRRIFARLGVGTRASMVARVLESAPRELFQEHA